MVTDNYLRKIMKSISKSWAFYIMTTNLHGPLGDAKFCNAQREIMYLCKAMWYLLFDTNVDCLLPHAKIISRSPDLLKCCWLLLWWEACRVSPVVGTHIWRFPFQQRCAVFQYSSILEMQREDPQRAIVSFPQTDVTQ